MSKVRKIRLVEEAEVELWNQVIYYEKQEFGLGLDFEKEVHTALKFIQENPRLWKPRKNGCCRFLINRFPFMIHYRIEDEKTIRIWAIAGTSQKPNYWSDRLK